jgi:hypothetical protein
MSGKAIRMSRDLYESLPRIYQVIAQIGERSGQVVIVREKPESRQKKSELEDAITAATSDILRRDNV